MHPRASMRLRDLAGFVAGLRDPGAVRDVLHALLTRREREHLALRWQVVRLLAEGVPQREVAARLGVSLCKVTRGARELKRGAKGFRRAVGRAVSASRKSKG